MPETTPTTKGSITWVHMDSRGIGAATNAAYARARAMHWTDDEASVADQRALVLLACMASAALSPRPPVLQQNDVMVYPTERSARADSQEYQAALMWGVLYLLGSTEADVKAGRLALQDRVRVETQDGSLPEGPTPEKDTGFPFLAVTAIIAATTAIAGCLVLWFSQNNELKATKILSDERVQKHAAALAELSSRIDSHVQAEQAHGQTLPWDEEERKTLDALRATTSELAKTPSSELASAPNLTSVSQAVAGAVSSTGTATAGAISNAGTSFGVVVGLGLLLWLLSDSNKQRHAQAA
jgi:outer membrane murein-binding lipoprotein Lpp